MDRKKITITALINAPIESVWNNWTNPKHIMQWNFAVDTWQCPKVENDLKVGGKYLARMEAKDGSFGFDFEAIYDVVNENQELTYTMSDGRKAMTRFESHGSTTTVTTTFDAESENPEEMQEQGWQAILNNFKKYTETTSK